MDTSNTDAAITGFVVVSFTLAFLPSVVAILRGKIGLAIFCGVVVGIATLLTMTVALAPIGIIVWIIALFVGGLAGRRHVVVIRERR